MSRGTTRRGKVLALAGMAALLTACLPGRDLLGPGSTPPPLDCRLEEDWVVGGFLSDEFDRPVCVPPAALLPVGHSRELFVAPFRLGAAGCDEAVSATRWVSTDPSVAAFTPGSRRRFDWLTGLATGETNVWAEVTLDNGRAITARLLNFSSSARVDTVRVIPPPGLPAGRSVIFRGSVDLLPQAAGSASQARLPFQVPVAGTLDMLVDWRSPTNRITPHLCAGEVPQGSGCIPLIDGTRFSGRKPVAASAAVSAGLHTLWVSSGGSGEERVAYEFGLVAR